MKIPAAVVCLLLFASVASAQKEPTPLADLKGLHILVEYLNDDAKSIGLSESALETSTFVALQRDIPRLKVSKEFPAAYIYIQVSAIVNHGYVAANVSVQLVRRVDVLGQTELEVVASILGTVWDKSKMIAGPPDYVVKRTKETIDEYVTEFAADYYKQNPTKESGHK